MKSAVAVPQGQLCRGMICDVRMHNLRALYSFYRKERNSAALSMGLTFGSCKIAWPRRFHVERRNFSHCHSGLSVGSALSQREAIQRTALVMGLGIITLLTVFPNEVGS
jgi:hypothetical protein